MKEINEKVDFLMKELNKVKKQISSYDKKFAELHNKIQPIL